MNWASIHSLLLHSLENAIIICIDYWYGCDSGWRLNWRSIEEFTKHVCLGLHFTGYYMTDLHKLSCLWKRGMVNHWFMNAEWSLGEREVSVANYGTDFFSFAARQIKVERKITWQREQSTQSCVLLCVCDILWKAQIKIKQQFLSTQACLQFPQSQILWTTTMFTLTVPIIWRAL